MGAVTQRIERSLTDTRQHQESLMRLSASSRLVFVEGQTFELRQRLKLYCTATPADWYLFCGGNVKRDIGFKDRMPTNMDPLSTSPLASPSPRTPICSSSPSPRKD